MTTLDLFTDIWNDTQAALVGAITNNNNNDNDLDENVTFYPASYEDDAAYDTYNNNTTNTTSGYGAYEDAGGYGYAGGDSYEKKEYGDGFYYGAMSVAVLTLGLVIVVEAILHRIDLSALQKPFYQAVLDAVYRECTL